MLNSDLHHGWVCVGIVLLHSVLPPSVPPSLRPSVPPSPSFLSHTQAVLSNDRVALEGAYDVAEVPSPSLPPSPLPAAINREF